MTSRAVLVSVPASNFCEKARWALQLARIPFREREYAPVLHLFGTIPTGGRSVPVLYWPESKRALTDSSDILDLCAQSLPTLYPTKETKELELFYDRSLGPHSRRTAYFMLFRDDAAARKMLLGPLEGLQYALGWLLYPPIRFGVCRLMKITESGAERSLTKIEELAKQAEERLGQDPVGSKFLTGDTFSAADISFCAHMALVLLPPENPFLTALRIEAFDHPMRQRIQTLQQSKAGQYVYWCYRTQRPPFHEGQSKL